MRSGRVLRSEPEEWRLWERTEVKSCRGLPGALKTWLLCWKPMKPCKNRTAEWLTKETKLTLRLAEAPAALEKLEAGPTG